VVGSGTIVDITKHAVLAVEQDEPSSDIVLTAVQTANSVCAFTSGLTVLTSDGVKRTVPSRLVDRLLLDTTLLAQAPREYTNGGIGDAAVSASSIADYRLAHLLGQGRWEPLAWDVVEPGRELFLGGAPAWADPGAAGAERLGLDLAACGLAMTFAGESAPLSGLEHVTSHMLDMAAEHRGRPVGNHGSQCGLATALVLIAFEVLLDEVDLQSVDLDDRAVDRDAEEMSVRTAFEHLDADGAAWRECWSDYSTKLDAWRAGASTIRDFQASWPAHRDDLRRYLVPAREYMRALAAAGHPLSWSDVPPGIGEDEARWAFENARLMRKRVSVADVLYFAGVWSTSFVDRIFDRFHEIRDEITA
jgi:glycerol-1-phosphate dehydrogenase [NAD(P)+]